MLNQLALDLTESLSPLFLTGAGISIASGIAPFRGTADAVWAKDVLEMGTRRMFERDPVKQWAWYLDRFGACRTAKPNAAHYAITKLQEWKAQEGVRLRVVTQNVDGLHVDAGTQDVIEVHGAARKMRCSRHGCAHGGPRNTLPWDDKVFTPFLADPKVETLPRCPACNKFLRPHVLWFDETYLDHLGYRFDDAQNLFFTSDLVVFVGTSFSVGITEGAIIAAGMKGAKVWCIDPNSPPPEGAGTWLQAKSEEALPALVQTLGA